MHRNAVCNSRITFCRLSFGWSDGCGVLMCFCVYVCVSASVLECNGVCAWRTIHSLRRLSQTIYSRDAICIVHSTMALATTVNRINVSNGSNQIVPAKENQFIFLECISIALTQSPIAMPKRNWIVTGRPPCIFRCCAIVLHQASANKQFLHCDSQIENE